MNFANAYREMQEFMFSQAVAEMALGGDPQEVLRKYAKARSSAEQMRVQHERTVALGDHVVGSYLNHQQGGATLLFDNLSRDLARFSEGWRQAGQAAAPATAVKPPPADLPDSFRTLLGPTE